MKDSKYIDHTLLKADATREEILRLCSEAKEYDFASVCVNPSWIPEAKQALEGTDVKVCVVVGFPLGAMTTEAKVFETADAVAKGADVLLYGHTHEAFDERLDGSSGGSVRVINPGSVGSWFGASFALLEIRDGQILCSFGKGGKPVTGSHRKSGQ